MPNYLEKIDLLAIVPQANSQPNYRHKMIVGGHERRPKSSNLTHKLDNPSGSTYCKEDLLYHTNTKYAEGESASMSGKFRLACGLATN